MKKIDVPASQEERAKTGAALARKRKAAAILTFVGGAVAALLLIGVLVVLLVLEFRGNSPAEQPLLYALAGGFAGGSVAFALGALALGKAAKGADRAERDFRERCDGEESFFVGEGTLAAFEKESLRIHAEDGKGETIRVPFSEMRFFSVCTRRAPKEKGEWSVVFEIPIKYLAKKGKYKAGDPPALVQTDGKRRLYDCIANHALTLVGELPQENPPRGKFERLKKYDFPDKRARNRALLLGGLGVVFIAAAVPVGIFMNVTAGSLFGVFGAFLLGRAGFAFAAAKSVLAFYREGLFWKEKNRAESMFLKWEEIVKISASEENGFSALDAECAYGAYHYPNPKGAMEFLKENFPDKVK